MPPKRASVSDLMSRPGVSVRKDKTVDKALDLMDRKDVSHLVVTGKGNTVVGLLSVRDVMEGLGSYRFEKIPARRVYVTALMVEPVKTIGPAAKVLDAIDMMLRENVGVIPVVEQGRLLGVITETDVMSGLTGDTSSKASSIMNPKHPRIDPAQRVVHARTVMLETGSRILPAAQGERLVGLVTERALARAFYDVRSKFSPKVMDSAVRRIIIEDVMLEDPQFVDQDETLGGIAESLQETGMPAIPVVERGLELRGVVERRALVNILAKR